MGTSLVWQGFGQRVGLISFTLILSFSGCFATLLTLMHLPFLLPCSNTSFSCLTCLTTPTYTHVLHSVISLQFIKQAHFHLSSASFCPHSHLSWWNASGVWSCSILNSSSLPITFDTLPVHLLPHWVISALLSHLDEKNAILSQHYLVQHPSCCC